MDRSVYYFNSHTEESSRERPPELSGVLAAMMGWKYPAAQTQPAASAQPHSPAASGKRRSGSQAAEEVDESATGFRYEVRMVFTKPERLGLTFAPDPLDGTAIVGTFSGQEPRHKVRQFNTVFGAHFSCHLDCLEQVRWRAVVLLPLRHSLHALG
jgi:hypothetical protein